MNDTEKFDEVIQNLNAPTKKQRLAALGQIAQALESGELAKPVFGDDVNNHIHTTYSFSPYSPSKAVYMAYMSGLTTAGIMDHDSVSGMQEFIEAGEIMNMATTVGFECRVSMKDTPFYGRRINNPDQDSVIYMAVHGVPHTQIEACKEFLKPYLEKRIERDRKMTDRINDLLKSSGIVLDFDANIVPISRYAEGGSITERHILYALSLKMIERFGKGASLVLFLKDGLHMEISKKMETHLLDENNPYYDYDLLGVLKSDMVSKFYIDADEECPDVREVTAFADKIGAISAYAYLGDVGDSVTGDKRAQKFEDDFIDALFEELKKLGFRAVTYMPSRNTLDQLRKVKSLCAQYGFFEISGEDINSPRQKFICEALKNPEFSNLIDSTWALIGHEMSATDDLSASFFSKETVAAYPDLQERIEVYKTIAKTKFI